MMGLLVYNLLLVLLSPLLLLYYAGRLLRGKEDAAHRAERWGKYETAKMGPGAIARDPRRPRFWVHAVSVGEVMAAAPVLRELRARYPRAFIVLSTITSSARGVALRQVPPADEVVYFPLDLPWVVRRALATARPDVVILMEWELWPNFLAAAKRRGTKVAVLNGRISDRGLRRGRRFAFFTAPGLGAVDLFAMQSEEDARRAMRVGADREKVVTLGNTKFDEAVAALPREERAALRADLGFPEGVPVWVCGSTRPGEEELLARALAGACRRHPDLCLVVAPRHIERAGEVEAVLRAAGLKVIRRSRQRKGEDVSAPSCPSVPVLLLDTFGELGHVYAVADVAFVGGSLLPFGGQSVFQPLAQGVPTLFGPHMNNQRDIAALSKAAGVGFEARDPDALAAQVVRLLSLSPAEKQTLSTAARALIERNQGVATRCVGAVACLLREKT